MSNSENSLRIRNNRKLLRRYKWGRGGGLQMTQRNDDIWQNMKWRGRGGQNWALKGIFNYGTSKIISIIDAAITS